MCKSLIPFALKLKTSSTVYYANEVVIGQRKHHLYEWVQAAKKLLIILSIHLNPLENGIQSDKQINQM